MKKDWLMVGGALRSKHRKKLLPRDPLPDHQAVHRAIAARDTAAARNAMAELLRLALQNPTYENE